MLIANKETKEIFYCKGKDANASGEYTDEGFVVFKGSICHLIESASAGPWLENTRKELIENQVLAQRENGLVFLENHIFSSPSAAAGVVLVREQMGGKNGRLKWGVPSIKATGIGVI